MNKSRGSKGNKGGRKALDFVMVEEAMELARDLLSRKRGISAWEIYLELERKLSIEVKDQEVEAMTSADSRGLAVRVISEGRVGFSYSNNFSRDHIARTLESAADSARYLSRDDAYTFASPEGAYPELDLTDRRLFSIPELEKIGAALEIERSALRHDPLVTRARGAEYEEYHGLTRVLNSNGVDAVYENTLVIASLDAVAEKDREAQTGSEFETSHRYDMIDFSRVGETAARRAVSMLGARPNVSGKLPVVLSPYAAAGLIAAMTPAAQGDAVSKNRSWLQGKLGERIASELVNLVDDALNIDGPAAAPFDDEGVRSRKTSVIEAGVLASYLFDTYYGHKEGKGSTGNGQRPSYNLPPSIDSTNWMLLPGEGEESSLIAAAEKGLYVLEFLGLHTADPVTGEFSLGASGFRIEKGKLGEPVAGVAIASSMGELLSRVSGVAEEIKFSGDAGAPAILIEELDISSYDHGRA